MDYKLSYKMQCTYKQSFQQICIRGSYNSSSLTLHLDILEANAGCTEGPEEPDSNQTHLYTLCQCGGISWAMDFIPAGS